MIIGSMKEVFLTHAMEVFLFDYRVAGMGPEAVHAYRDVLRALIQFTGDIKVRQLTPEHVRMYIANLSDGPSEGPEHSDMVMSQYAIIQTWIHWMYAQKFIIERDGSRLKHPDFASLFPSRLARRLPHYWVI